jgi:hypothetical protein
LFGSKQAGRTKFHTQPAEHFGSSVSSTYTASKLYSTQHKLSAVVEHSLAKRLSKQRYFLKSVYDDSNNGNLIHTTLDATSHDSDDDPHDVYPSSSGNNDIDRDIHDVVISIILIIIIINDVVPISGSGIHVYPPQHIIIATTTE